MKDNSLLKLGGACAILLGVVNASSSLLYFFIPAEQRAAQPAAVILPSIAQGAPFLIILFWTQAIVGILGMVVVPALSRIFQNVNAGWVRWTTNLAVFGFAISAVGYFLDIEKLQNIARAYVNGDAQIKALLTATWKSSLDEQGFWGYGAVGAWMLVISLLALRTNRFPRLLCYLGIALGLLNLLTPPGVMLKSQPMLLIIVGAAAIISPIWYIWSGLIARRSANDS
jgi:hypothetical protein